MSEYDFTTPGPIRLFAEIGRGRIALDATETATTHVSVRGDKADEIEVIQEDDLISIVSPRRSGFSREPEVDVVVTLPVDSELAIRTGSADIAVDGPVGATRVKTGSGDIRIELLGGPSDLESGSGDVHVGTASAQLRIKSGSGDIRLDHTDDATSVSTGSGDTMVGEAFGALAVKSGSGDLEIRESHSDVAFATGSGDVQLARAHRGRVDIRGASGDVLIGVVEGIPVWTDVFTVTGDISSDLVGAGEPAEGADYVELRAKTVSGDISLRQR